MYIYIYISLPINLPLYIYIPIGSIYAVYGNIYHQYTPVMLAYIPAPWIRHGIYIIYNVYINVAFNFAQIPAVPINEYRDCLTKVVSSLANRMASCTSTVLKRKLGRWWRKARPQQRKQRS